MGGDRMEITNEIKQRILDLSDQGFSNCEVARRIGCSEKSVRRVLLRKAESSANVTSSDTCANSVAPEPFTKAILLPESMGRMGFGEACLRGVRLYLLAHHGRGKHRVEIPFFGIVEVEV
jgi:transposase-like protein